MKAILTSMWKDAQYWCDWPKLFKSIAFVFGTAFALLAIIFSFVFLLVKMPIVALSLVGCGFLGVIVAVVYNEWDD